MAEKRPFLDLLARARHCVRLLGKAAARLLWATTGLLVAVLGAVAMSVRALIFALSCLKGRGRSTTAAVCIDLRDGAGGHRIGKPLHGRPEETFIKAERLWQLGRKHGFVYPRPIEVVDGILWSEYLANLRPVFFDYLHFMYARDRSVRALFSELGAALGAIHCNLQVPQATAWQPPASFEEAAAKILGTDYRAILAETPQRPLHCDFGFPNIHLIEKGGRRRLVILDAEANGYQTLNTLTVGSIYLDLANFAMCVSGAVPLRHQVFMLARSRTQALLHAFLAGYRQNTGYKIDNKLLARLTLATTISYLSRSGPWGFGPFGQPLAHLMFARQRFLPDETD